MDVVFHGGRLDAAMSEFGGSREDWLDLSTGINPNAYPLTEIPLECWQRLPDETAQSKLLNAARNYYRVPKNAELVASNGTQAILQILPLLLAQEKIAIVSPTYEEHRHCWKQAGRDVVAVKSLDEAVSVAEIVVIVNPNNPTGSTYHPDQLTAAAQRLNVKSGFLIVDEAFGDVKPELSVVSQFLDNMVVLRSFGKFFGLAGLRLGFVICSELLAKKISSKQGPWNVSGPALEIGTAAFSDEAWASSMRMQILQNSEDQAEVMKACGLEQIGNAGLFMEFEHSKASEIIQVLLKNHVLVRPFPERNTRIRFGLCKNMDELERLAWALKSNA